MITTQINRDGTTTIWNQGLMTIVPGNASSNHVARLNKLRDERKLLSESQRWRLKQGKFSFGDLEPTFKNRREMCV